MLVATATTVFLTREIQNMYKLPARFSLNQPEFQPIHGMPIPQNGQSCLKVKETIKTGVPYYDYASLERRLKDFFELELALDRWLGIEQKIFVLDSYPDQRD